MGKKRGVVDHVRGPEGQVRDVAGLGEEGGKGNIICKTLFI